jgi:hypothetical protein
MILKRVQRLRVKPKIVPRQAHASFAFVSVTRKIDWPELASDGCRGERQASRKLSNRRVNRSKPRT